MTHLLENFKIYKIITFELSDPEKVGQGHGVKLL